MKQSAIVHQGNCTSKESRVDQDAPTDADQWDQSNQERDFLSSNLLGTTVAEKSGKSGK
jgi:hypothetical protein